MTLRTRLATATLAPFLMLAALTPAFAEEVPLRTITVTGDGEVTQKPDLATLSIGVRHEAQTAAEALDRMSAAMTPVMERLVAAGIAATDVQTGSLSLEPLYDYSYSSGPPKFLGFAAATSVTVTIRDLGLVGGVLDAVVEDGANTLGGIAFGLADPSAALNGARQEAVEDARARAELYAAAAGVTLGELITLTESGGYAPQPVMYDARMEMASGAPVPIAAGEVGVTAQVTLVYRIAD